MNMNLFLSGGSSTFLSNPNVISILMLFAGLAVFMYGLKILSERLEKQAGGKLKDLFSAATKNRFRGMAVGAGVTAIIQSSSATTVMVVGLVNAGILTLVQATAVIMGANIGTTVTALLISLPVAEIIAASGIVGVFMVMFSKRNKVRNIGYIIIGLGLIFAGLKGMGNSMKQFAKNPAFTSFFTNTNPLLLVVIGALFTAIIQSSSATTGILITLSTTGGIDMRASIFVILGINIGTCITAILASIGANPNAKRAAAVHLMFNLAGTLIWGLLFLIPGFLDFIVHILESLGTALFKEKGPLGASIAAFHIIFNISTTLLLLMFIKQLVYLAEKIIPKKENDESEQKLKYVNEIILESPAMAMAQTKKEILRMAEMSKKNFNLAVNSLCEMDLSKEKEFANREKYLDWLQEQLSKYLTKISSAHISYESEKVIASYYHVIADIERIGDYSENIFENIEKLKDDKSSFSESAVKEVKEMQKSVNELYETSVRGFKYVDITLRDKVEELEDVVDIFKADLSEKHITRLNEGKCNATSGAVFLSTVSNMERIADHMRNIFASIRRYTKKSKSAIVVKATTKKI